MGVYSDPLFVRNARKALAEADGRMAELIERFGRFAPGVVSSTFEALIKSIIHQQLSMKAARTISQRVQRLSRSGRFSAAGLAAVSGEELRAAGLSRSKVEYVRNVCEHFRTGAVRPAKLRRMPDEAVIQTLVAIRGVGIWTAEMILIFNLQRPDVWPVDDLGLRQALHRWFAVPAGARRPQFLAAGERFRPYRSVATWYLWRSLDGGVVPGFR